MFPRDGGRVSKVSSHGDTSSSVPNSSFISSCDLNTPRIGANQSAEPLQGAQQSCTGNNHAVLAIVKLTGAGSSISGSKSSREVSAEPEETTETAQPTEPVSMIDGASNREEPQATGPTSNNVSSSSILLVVI